MVTAPPTKDPAGWWRSRKLWGKEPRGKLRELRPRPSWQPSLPTASAEEVRSEIRDGLKTAVSAPCSLRLLIDVDRWC